MAADDYEDLTEDRWLACTDPARMLEHLLPGNSDRSDRLFAIACCRRIWDLIEDPRSRHAVETAERFVEGVVDQDELQAAAEHLRAAAPHVRGCFVLDAILAQVGAGSA